MKSDTSVCSQESEDLNSDLKEPQIKFVMGMGKVRKGIDEQGNKVKMSDTQRYKQMGNAVTTNVIKAVGEKISLFEETTLEK